MGSEQSTSSRSGSHRKPQRSSGGAGNGEAGTNLRSSSPRPSISSDSDIPYVSYAINRPIGDSPKLPTKSPAHSLRTSTPSPRPSPKPQRPKSYAGSTSTSHDIIIVKESSKPTETLETDPEYQKLQSIPSFLPIMRASLNIPTIRDPEVLDKLDYKVVLKLCLRYQSHLRHCADTICAEQNLLADRIREIDFAIATLMSMLTERQKKFAKYAEQLSKVQELSTTLQKCQNTLEDIIETMDELNSLLPSEDRETLGDLMMTVADLGEWKLLLSEAESSSSSSSHSEASDDTHSASESATTTSEDDTSN